MPLAPVSCRRRWSTPSSTHCSDRRPPTPAALAAPAGEARGRRRAGSIGSRKAVGRRLRQESRLGVPDRHRRPAPRAPPGRAFPGSVVRQRVGDRRTSVRRDDDPGHDDDHRGLGVPPGARAVLLRGRRRSSLAAVGGLPHVAGLAPAVDREGVGRIIASVLGIVAEREAVFAKTGLDMDEVRRRKFSEKPEPVPVAGGDVIPGHRRLGHVRGRVPQLVDHIVALARALSYGVHVVISHTSYLQGFKQALKPLATARVELRLTDPGDSEMDRQLAKKVPRGVPGRGLTKAGMHLLVGVPELAERPDGRVAARDIGPLIAEVSGIQRRQPSAGCPRRCRSKRFSDWLSDHPSQSGPVRPFGGRPGPAYLDIADHPHAIAVGAPGRAEAISCGCCAGRLPPATARKRSRSWCSIRVARCSVWSRVRTCATTPTARALSARRSASWLLSWIPDSRHLVPRNKR